MTRPLAPKGSCVSLISATHTTLCVLGVNVFPEYVRRVQWHKLSKRRFTNVIHSIIISLTEIDLNGSVSSHNNEVYYEILKVLLLFSQHTSPFQRKWLNNLRVWRYCFFPSGLRHISCIFFSSYIYVYYMYTYACIIIMCIFYVYYN